MPTVSIYIKNEDWAAWRALDKPSEFIHQALNQVAAKKSVMPRLQDPVVLDPAKEPHAALSEIVEEARVMPLFRDKKKGKL